MFSQLAFLDVNYRVCPLEDVKVGNFNYILFGTELHLKNVYYLYSACSNPTNDVSVIILNMIIGKGLDNGTAKFYWCVITQAITKTIT